MTPIITQPDALQTYHTHYDNTTYTAVQVAVVTDISGPLIARQPLTLDEALAQKPINALMNAVTDAALGYCGHPGMTRAEAVLVGLVAHAGLSPETVAVIAAHLANFDAAASADFAHKTVAAATLHRISADLYTIKSNTSAVRGPVGHTADHLAAAADAVCTLAGLVLAGESSSTYLDEKLGAAQRALRDAEQTLNAMRARR